MRGFTLSALIVLVPLAAARAADDAPAPAETRQLFNGENLSGWVVEGSKDYKSGDEKRPVWTVEDGQIVCAGRGYGFLRYDEAQFGDFVFHLEYQMKPRCNSGIGIRGTKFAGSAKTRPSFHSYEIQLLDDAGKSPSKHSSYSLYRYAAAQSNPGKPAGEWNTMEIECVGPQITITVNGEEVHDLDQTTLPQTKDKPLCGYLSLQNHGGQIAFRNLWVRELAPCTE